MVVTKPGADSACHSVFLLWLFYLLFEALPGSGIERLAPLVPQDPDT